MEESIINGNADYYDKIYDVNMFGVENRCIELSNHYLFFNNSIIEDNFLTNKERVAVNKIFENDYVDGNNKILQRLDRDEKAVIDILNLEESYLRFDKTMFDLFYNKLDTKRMRYGLEIHDKLLKIKNAMNIICRLHDRLGLNVDKIVQLAMQYVKINTGKNIKISDIKVEKPVREDFNKKNIDIYNEKDLIYFYSNTFSYILELTAANYQIETLSNYNYIIDYLISNNIYNVLDYAGGIGTFSLFCSIHDINVNYCDIKSNTYNYARYFFDKFNLDIKANVTEPNKLNLINSVDCIACLEVLEHMYCPEKFILDIRKKLNKNGLFIVSESFDYTDNFCTHIPYHKGKGGANFINFMSNLGFIMIDQFKTSHCKIFKKTM